MSKVLRNTEKNVLRGGSWLEKYSGIFLEVSGWEILVHHNPGTLSQTFGRKKMKSREMADVLLHCYSDIWKSHQHNAQFLSLQCSNNGGNCYSCFHSPNVLSFHQTSKCYSFTAVLHHPQTEHILSYIFLLLFPFLSNSTSAKEYRTNSTGLVIVKDDLRSFEEVCVKTHEVKLPWH